MPVAAMLPAVVLLACVPCDYTKQTNAFVSMWPAECQCVHLNSTCGEPLTWGLLVPEGTANRIRTTQYYVQAGVPVGRVPEHLFRAGADVHILDIDFDADTRVGTIRFREYKCGEDWAALPLLSAETGFTPVGLSRIARVKSAAAALVLCSVAIGLPLIAFTVGICVKPKQY